MNCLEHKIYIEKFLREKLEDNISGCEVLKGGYNCSAYKLTTTRGMKLLLKEYKNYAGDDRQRLDTEYNSIEFLWRKGIRTIPKPFFKDDEHNIGIFQFVEGVKVSAEEIRVQDIDKMVEFIRSIFLLSCHEDAMPLPSASEACFSIKEHMNCVDSRISELDSISDHFSPMKAFLENEFKPFYQLIKQFVIKEASKREIEIDDNLGVKERILSPSDFGFHNSLKQQDGSFVFVDFEYFGWDDPVKLLSDFILHPAVPLPLKFRSHFIKKMCGFLHNPAKLLKRLPLIYLLLSLKWSLIMLNTFLRESTIDFQINQLNKSMQKLLETKREFEEREYPLSLLN